MNLLKIRCLGLLLLIGSCAAQSRNVCSLEVAEKIGAITQQRLQALFGQAVTSPRVVIDPDASKASGSDVLMPFGHYERASQTVHIACRVQGRDWFASAVRHEVTHHYLSQAFGRLPLWLSEGLATYMEYENLDASQSNLPINRPRLNEFRELIKWGIAPSLHQLMSQDSYAQSTSRHYSAYWALTFALLHHPDEAIQRKRRQLLFDRMYAAKQAPSQMDQVLVEGLVQEKSDIQSWELDWRRQLWALR